ncbi:unnamed protein product [Pieris brassicae]|uniref:Uncharacterized protein n=1 Tax=Pieris brassicae TaxID=7116 RepID=A0A9P0TIV6_PIEBR|nr:unnamed protein product [Pieris brassicae]
MLSDVYGHFGGGGQLGMALVGITVSDTVLQNAKNRLMESRRRRITMHWAAIGLAHPNLDLESSRSLDICISSDLFIIVTTVSFC